MAIITNMKSLSASVLITISFFSGVTGCQTPPQEAPAIGDRVEFVHISTDFQGAVSGYHCVGAPDKTVATVQDCGGSQNVETVLIGNTKELSQQQVSPGSADTMGFTDVIGNLNETLTLPSDLLNLAADPSQSLSSHLLWDCENCTVLLSGSTFAVTTPIDVTRHAFSAGGNAEQFKLRLIGCMRLIETSGIGTHANKRGFMCGNSIVSFDKNLNTVGSANYRIALRKRLRG